MHIDRLTLLQKWFIESTDFSSSVRAVSRDHDARSRTAFRAFAHASRLRPWTRARVDTREDSEGARESP